MRSPKYVSLGLRFALAAEWLVQLFGVAKSAIAAPQAPAVDFEAMIAFIWCCSDCAMFLS